MIRCGGTPRLSAGLPVRALWAAMETVRFDPMIPSPVNNWRLCSGGTLAVLSPPTRNCISTIRIKVAALPWRALRWAVENGILNGDGQLGPQGQATWAQVAQMLKNFIENEEDDTIQ